MILYNAESVEINGKLEIHLTDEKYGYKIDYCSKVCLSWKQLFQINSLYGIFYLD